MKPLRLHTQSLLALYRRLLSTYGEQGWWPADSVFEIMVGAVLTQNTAWTNVEKAITRLRNAGCLNPQSIAALPVKELASLIRPSGYFNIKANRLQNLVCACEAIGGEQQMHSMPTEELRNFLLSVNGVGPETADDILLYAFDRKVFVIDTYTRRLLSTLNLIEGDEPYEVLRASIERSLRSHSHIYGEYHALIVNHAKQVCKRKEGKDGCPHCRVVAGLGRSGRLSKAATQQ